MDLSRTISEINSDFARKSQKIPPPCIKHPDEGFHLEFSNGGSAQKTSYVPLPDG